MVEQLDRDSRGILHPASAPITLDRFPPRGGAARFVDRYWISSWRLPEGMRHEQQVLIHPVVNVVFEAGGAIVGGVDTGRFATVLEGSGRALGIMFRPGGFHPFLQRSSGSLTDTVVPLSSGVATLASLEAILTPLVADAAVPPAVLAETADEALAPLVPEGRQPCETTTEWAEQAVRDRSLTRVEDLAAAAGVSMRTLQRAFTEHIGIGPKWFLRRYRLYEAGEQVARRAHVDWAELAAGLGYADQAHLTRDFTAAFGLPPAQYAAVSARATATATAATTPTTAVTAAAALTEDRWRVTDR